MLWPWPVPPPACLPVVHPSASVCCTSYPMSSPAPKLPTLSFLPANLHVSYLHLYLMEKLSEQVPLPACPLSSVCLHAGLKAPLQVRFQYGVPLLSASGSWLSSPSVSAEPPVPALQTSLLLPLSADSVPDPSPEVRRLTSTGTVCESGQNRARDGNSTCQAPLSFPAANIPVSTQDEPGTEMETAQRGRKGEGWPTDGLISNPQPPLQPSKGTGTGHRSCDRASSSFSPLNNLFFLGR